MIGKTLSEGKGREGQGMEKSRNEGGREGEEEEESGGGGG